MRVQAHGMRCFVSNKSGCFMSIEFEEGNGVRIFFPLCSKEGNGIKSIVFSQTQRTYSRHRGPVRMCAFVIGAGRDRKAERQTHNNEGSDLLLAFPST